MKKLTLLMMVLLAFTACGSDDEDDYKEEIKYTYTDIPYTQGQSKYAPSTSSWSFSNTANWAYFTPNSGVKGETSLYRYKENPTNTMRYDTVTITQVGIKTYDIIRQAANPNK